MKLKAHPIPPLVCHLSLSRVAPSPGQPSLGHFVGCAKCLPLDPGWIRSVLVPPHCFWCRVSCLKLGIYIKSNGRWPKGASVPLLCLLPPSLAPWPSSPALPSLCYLLSTRASPAEGACGSAVGILSGMCQLTCEWRTSQVGTERGQPLQDINSAFEGHFLLCH